MAACVGLVDAVAADVSNLCIRASCVASGMPVSRQEGGDVEHAQYGTSTFDDVCRQRVGPGTFRRALVSKRTLLE